MQYLKDNPDDMQALAREIQGWAIKLGFQQCGISDTDLSAAEQKHLNWLAQGYHGDMDWMQHHGDKRTRPDLLVPGTIRILSVRMDYWPQDAHDAWQTIADSEKGYVSRYALGRDYHKLMRQRLQKLADKIKARVGEFGFRVFVDSAPVLEKPLAEKAGLGWIGKHTNVINKEGGSWFFLGEIYTDLPLPTQQQISSNHCGTCQSCIEACPTQAIIAPYELDARLCISYLTIEHKGPIPIELRSKMGNRIYGCDDCQLVCPWNRFAQASNEIDFNARHHLDNTSLLELFSWTAQEFEQRFQGSAIRRIGYEKWMRNIAVALGNVATDNAELSRQVVQTLQKHLNHESELIREHVEWALAQHSA